MPDHNQGSHTLSALYRHSVDDPGPKPAADTFRDALWRLGVRIENLIMRADAQLLPCVKGTAWRVTPHPA